MILIFGGAYQGKLEYALERFGLDESDVYRCGNNADTPQNKKIIYEIDKWIYELVKTGADARSKVRECIKNNPGAIVICNDISCGVVPAKAIEREWREEAGRALAEFSKASSEVTRLFCGIPTKIK